MLANRPRFPFQLFAVLVEFCAVSRFEPRTETAPLDKFVPEKMQAIPIAAAVKMGLHVGFLPVGGQASRAKIGMAFRQDRR